MPSPQKASKPRRAWPTPVFVLALNSLLIAQSNPRPSSLVPYGFHGLCGALGQSDSTLDGLGPAARLMQMRDICSDGLDNLYVTNGSCIRKISSDGRVTTFAGSISSGYVDTEGHSPTGKERFQLPLHLAADPMGNVYVLDSNNTLRKINAEGVVSTLAGQAGVSATGIHPMDSSQQYPKGVFRNPVGIAADPDGNVYVSEAFCYGESQTGRYYAIRRITPQGQVSTFFKTPTLGYEPFSLGRIRYHDGSLYCITHGMENTWTWDPKTIPPSWQLARLDLKTLAWSAALKYWQQREEDKPVGEKQLTDLAFGGPTDGDLYVKTQSNAILKYGSFNGWRFVGDYNRCFGSLGAQILGTSNGPVEEARFWFISGLAPKTDGKIAFCEWGSGLVRQIGGEDRVDSLAGLAGMPSYSPELKGIDGSLGAARLNTPKGVCFGKDKAIYIADTGTHSIRRLDDPRTPNARMTTLAGEGGTAGKADGIGNSARFNAPQSLAAASSNILFVADTGNHRICKLTLNPSTGQWGSQELQTNVQLTSPTYIVMGPKGLPHCISQERIHCLTQNANGTWSASPLVTSTPIKARCMTADARGNLYVIPNAYYNTPVIQVKPDGSSSVIAVLNDGGNNMNLYSNITGLAVNPSGSTLYLANQSSQHVLRLNKVDNTWRWATSPCKQEMAGHVLGQKGRNIVLPGAYIPGELPPSISLDSNIALAVHPETGDLVIPMVHGLTVATRP